MLEFIVTACLLADLTRCKTVRSHVCGRRHLAETMRKVGHAGACQMVCRSPQLGADALDVP